jgi:recombination protein RecA
MAKKTISRPKTLEDALKKIATDRDLRIASLGEFDLDVKAISTGNIAIDHITGVGGLPKGRIIELYGPPSSGKTTTALQAAAHAQKEGTTVLYLDYEHALDPAYCVALGIDVHDDSFLLAQPNTFEQGMNAMRELVSTGGVGLVIVDSVAAMVIEKELEIETGGSTFADKAKLMAQTMRQITPPIQDNEVVCVFLNHLQDVIDSSPMGQKLSAQGIKRTTTPGGKALKFHASVRLEYKQIGNLRTAEVDELTNEKSDLPTQTKVQVTVTKNKVAPPFKQCVVRVRFGKGFSQAYSVLDILLAYGVIKKRTGGIYEFDEDTKPEWMDLDKPTIRGEEQVLRKLESDSEWLENLTAFATRLLDENDKFTLASHDEEEPDEDPEQLREMLGERQ